MIALALLLFAGFAILFVRNYRSSPTLKNLSINLGTLAPEPPSTPRHKKHEGRVAVIESTIDISKVPVYEKTDEERQFLRETLRNNFIFGRNRRCRDTNLRDTMVDAFEKHVVPDGTDIIIEGDNADYFYVIESGVIEFSISGKDVGARGEGEYFGDLALLRNCSRAATCTSSGECVLWRLGQGTYRSVVARNHSEDSAAVLEIVKKVPLFTSLNDNVLMKIVGAMREKKFEKDSILMTKGDIGTEMFIIKSGSILLKDIAAKGRKYNNVELAAGDFFGERAILESEPRAATAVMMEDSILYSISMDSFVKHIGSMDQLKRDAAYLRILKSIPAFANSDLTSSEYEELISRIQTQSLEKGSVIYNEGANNDKLYLIESGEVKLSSGPKDKVFKSENAHFGEDNFLNNENLATETVTAKVDLVFGVLSSESVANVIRSVGRLDGHEEEEATSESCLDDVYRHRILGMGAFGKVWLATFKKKEDCKKICDVYALKVQKKRQLLDSKMSEAIIREAAIMKSLDHPSVMKLHNVYQDEKEVYFLTNFIQGGELYRLLNQDGIGVALDPNDARFYAAGVFEGLNHMHTRGILYRDLKPENVLIGDDGYPVLVDLGFAKKMTENKTFTMCGSPFYIAPEVLLGTGHDKSFDHWAWAIMLHELLSGDVPFKESAKSSQIKLFKAIVKGKFRMSTLLDEAALDLIKNILVADVAERLGSLAGGVKDIKNHEFFSKIDFEKIGSKTITPPWKPDLVHPLDCSEFEDFSHEEYEDDTPAPPLSDTEKAVFLPLHDIMSP